MSVSRNTPCGRQLWLSFERFLQRRSLCTGELHGANRMCSFSDTPSRSREVKALISVLTTLIVNSLVRAWPWLKKYLRDRQRGWKSGLPSYFPTHARPVQRMERIVHVCSVIVYFITSTVIVFDKLHLESILWEREPEVFYFRRRVTEILEKEVLRWLFLSDFNARESAKMGRARERIIPIGARTGFTNS